MNRRLFLLVLLFIAALAYFSYFEPQVDSPQVGDTAPVFSLKNSNQDDLSLADYKGRIVLVNFWATWCPPCVWEMPSLNELYQQFKADGFEVLAVSVDEDGWQAIQSFLKVRPVDFPIVLDVLGEVAALYHSYQLPESYLIDQDGAILKVYIGPQKWTNSEIMQTVSQAIRRAGTVR